MNKEKLLVIFMWVTGIGTALVGLGLIAPSEIQQSMFGAPSEDPLALLLARGWSGLVGLMGILLIIGARRPALRTFCLNVSGGSKAMFIGMILIWGQAYVPTLAGALFIDALVVLVAIANQIQGKERR
ncbi:hypothetical protein OAD56_03025 [Gammaproteobacteria bacterium]|jgi:hypothetical protein|uniref:Uncharacterized protein n=1 Tax=OM182 bacterium BACL3 MAG-120531-bin86 TaxID=1655628 RepID=A0A0R2XUJ7_9GAMM|nr:MAG: hypothetical protein ABS26_08280 [OM182 bacterium BACL3 MAG-120531-bin86]MBT3521994.1 hypothetical protein [Gammaproteobacteria bacterium]MDO7657392.1 hypothetical protein [OM182 bacterium]MBT4782586.1 hypothetical protein [Gammaproteobacteria bacterium]MBT5906571.1 hypothetical protein [Gammaproteobacteria bacterium]|tara:strand:- start:6521 stop:6904 length:384 start_codon:yes stop_codon:yes gene_type:complete